MAAKQTTTATTATAVAPATLTVADPAALVAAMSTYVDVSVKIDADALTLHVDALTTMWSHLSPVWADAVARHQSANAAAIAKGGKREPAIATFNAAMSFSCAGWSFSDDQVRECLLARAHSVEVRGRYAKWCIDESVDQEWRGYKSWLREVAAGNDPTTAAARRIQSAADRKATEAKLDAVVAGETDYSDIVPEGMALRGQYKVMLQHMHDMRRAVLEVEAKLRTAEGDEAVKAVQSTFQRELKGLAGLK